MRKTALDLVEPPAWQQDLVINGEHIIVRGRWEFLVESQEFPGEFHALDLEDREHDGKCTCTSSRVRGECRHERTIKRWLRLPT